LFIHFRICFILLQKIKNLYNKQKTLYLKCTFYIKKIYDIRHIHHTHPKMDKKVSIKDDDRNNHRNNDNGDGVVCDDDYDVCGGDVCGGGACDGVCGGVCGGDACDD
jgi:hypothetical protein